MSTVAIIAGALAAVAGPVPVVGDAPALRDFVWHPILPAPHRSALGTYGPPDDRTIGLLMIGMPGATPRLLTVFRFDCAADRVLAIKAFAIDPTLTHATAVASAFTVQSQAEMLAAGQSLSIAKMAEDTPAGAVAKLACDDTQMNTLRTAPLSKLNDDATYIDDEQDRK